MKSVMEKTKMKPYGSYKGRIIVTPDTNVREVIEKECGHPIGTFDVTTNSDNLLLWKPSNWSDLTKSQKCFYNNSVIITGSTNLWSPMVRKDYKIYTYRKVWHYEQVSNQSSTIQFWNPLYLPLVGNSEKTYEMGDLSVQLKWTSSYKLIPYYSYPKDAIIVDLDHIPYSTIDLESDWVLDAARAVKWHFVNLTDTFNTDGTIDDYKKWHKSQLHTYSRSDHRRGINQTQYYNQERLENAYFICDGKLYQCVYCDWADSLSGDNHYEDTILFSEIEVPTYDALLYIVDNQSYNISKAFANIKDIQILDGLATIDYTVHS